jgi:hypothetical protein
MHDIVLAAASAPRDRALLTRTAPLGSPLNGAGAGAHLSYLVAHIAMALMENRTMVASEPWAYSDKEGIAGAELGACALHNRRAHAAFDRPVSTGACVCCR